MKITVKKSDNVDVILQTSYTEPCSINEMRDTLALALDQEGYDESFIDSVFNIYRDECKACEPECDARDYFSEQLEKQCPELHEEIKTTEFEDKANKIIDFINNTVGPVKVLWILNNLYEADEAIRALDQDCFRGFSIVTLENRYLISRPYNSFYNPSDRDVSVVLSTEDIKDSFTLVV